MPISIHRIEYEIFHMLLVTELCASICCSINYQPDAHKAQGFVPFYYNLNYSKMLNTLHSLLLSRDKSELTLENYYRWKRQETHDKKALETFAAELKQHQSNFNRLQPIHLRHKITAHADKNWIHSNFTQGYILPVEVQQLRILICEVKESFCKIANFTAIQSHEVILQESKIMTTRLHTRNPR